MRVVVLDDYGGVFERSAACAKLRERGHEVQCGQEAHRSEALINFAAGAEAVLLTQQRTPFPQAVIEGLTDLQWLLNTGRNLGHVDDKACEERKVQIVTSGGGSPEPAAEMTWALIMASARRVVENNESLRAGRWIASAGTTLHGKTLGIYGLGSIGSIVARVGAAFSMRVLCFGREGGSTAKEAEAKGYEFAQSREAFFKEADVLSIHLKSTPETKGSVTSADLEQMKPSAILVNTSRAALIEPGALVTALKADCPRPGFAALDVFDEEPLPPEDELLKLPNVLLTPHIGYVTTENMEQYYDSLVDEFLKRVGGSPQ